MVSQDQNQGVNGSVFLIGGSGEASPFRLVQDGSLILFLLMLSMCLPSSSSQQCHVRSFSHLESPWFPLLLLAGEVSLLLGAHMIRLGPTQLMGFPGGISSKESACQCMRHKRRRFSPWVGKIPLEEGVATHSSILAWGIPWTEEPGGLWSISLQRVRHNWSDWAGIQLISLF